MEIDAKLFARRDITRLGVAPFSSMYWYGETSRRQIVDWRPEIHDSDGIAIWTGAGERIWRPLNNPPRVMSNAFVDNDVRGFGLLQRDRDFVHYLDDSVFYERRASVWVEPILPFGEGEVHLLEIPTDDEIHDNIAAYWCPKAPFKAGESRRYLYRVRWLDDIPFPRALAKATATWTGIGGRPGHKRPEGVRKFVVDFQGSSFRGIGREDGVEIVVTPSRGTLSNAYCHPVVDQRERWRALFDLEATGSEPVDIRMFLRQGRSRADRNLGIPVLPGNLIGVAHQPALGDRLFVEVAFGNFGELRVGAVLFLQRLAEQLRRFGIAEKVRPRDERAIAGDLVVLDGLGRGNHRGIARVGILDFRHQLFRFFQDAVDGRTLGSLRAS